jgi:hypothetical protein
VRTGIGTACPSGNPIARGECALQAGLQPEAATQFRAAMASRDSQLAAAPGDLALRLATWPPPSAGTGAPASRDRRLHGRRNVCRSRHPFTSTEIVKRVFDTRAARAGARRDEPPRCASRLGGAHAVRDQDDVAVDPRRLAGLDVPQWREIVCRRPLLQLMRETAVTDIFPGRMRRRRR